MPIRVEPKRKRPKGRGGPQRGMDPKNPRKRLEEVNPRPAPKAPQDPLAPTVPDRIKKRFKKFNPLFPGMSGLPTSRLTGGQIKIAAKAPPRNKIDGKDFAVLKAEKAKGRGMGLQDEKLKPGKVTKAFAGALAVGLGAKKAKDKKKMAPVAMGGIGASMIKAEAMKKILGRNKGGMGDATKYKKYLKSVKDVRMKNLGSKFLERRAKLAGTTVKGIERAAKATRYGKIALGVAGVGLAAKEYLKRKMKKNEKKKKSVMEGDIKGSIKPYVKKKMGGGMMKKPMSYDKGGDAFLKRRMKLGDLKSILPGRMKILVPAGIALGVAASKGADKIREKSKEMKKNKKMGGGMMMRPNPVGYKKGVLVKVKLGRNKPTKLY